MGLHRLGGGLWHRGVPHLRTGESGVPMGLGAAPGISNAGAPWRWGWRLCNTARKHHCIPGGLSPSHSGGGGRQCGFAPIALGVLGRGCGWRGGGGPGTGGKPGRGGGSRWRQVDFNTGVGPGPRGVCAAPVSHGCAAGSSGCPGAAGAWPGAKAAPSPASKRCRRPSPKAPCPVPLPSGPELRVPPAAFRPHSSAWARGCRVPVL